MIYMIYFYGVNPTTYRSAIKELDIVSRVLSLAKKENRGLSDGSLQSIARLLEAGINDHWPYSNSPDGFVAFHWLLETIAEPIVIERLLNFKSWSYWESTGLWDYFLSASPPYPVPSSPGRVPKVGYLSLEGMMRMLEAESHKTFSERDDCRAVRSEVLEVVESLLQDELPMLAIALN